MTNNNDMSGMDDLYSGDESKSAPKSVDQEEADNPTALIAKSLIGDVSVGDTVTLKVVAEHGDEVEVEPVKEAEDESAPMPMDANAELDSMNE